MQALFFLTCSYYMQNVFLKSFILVLAILMQTAAFSQKIEISGSVKLNNKLPNFRVLGKTGNKYVVERYGPNFHVLDVYNPYMKSQGSKHVSLEKDEFIERFWIQPKISWIIKVLQEKNRSYIQAVKMNDKLAIAGKPLVLDSLDERKDLLENNLRTTLSLNESKILVYTPVFSQGRISYFYSRVYDTNMNLVNSNDIKDENLLNNEFEKVILLNNGSYIFIAKSKAAEVYYFTMIDENGNMTKTTFTPVKDVFKNLEFEIDNENNAILVAGFFRDPSFNKKDRIGAKEFFISSLNLEDFNNNYTEVVPFTQNFYTLLTGKESELDPPQLFTFYVKSIIPKIDGGAIVLTESFFKTEEQFQSDAFFSVAGIPNYNYTTYYNFNDIVVYHIDSNGVFLQQEIIKKKQLSQNDGGSYSSFYVANLRNELFALFLDDIAMDAYLSKARISEEDKTRTNTILNVGGKDVFPVLKMSKQTAPNEILIPSFKKNKLRLIKVLF